MDISDPDKQAVNQNDEVLFASKSVSQMPNFNSSNDVNMMNSENQ